MHPIHSMLFALCKGDAGTMTIRQLSVLGKLREGDEKGLDFGDVAKDLALSKPAMSRAVDRLAELELVGKTVSPLDARKVMIKLTAKGIKFCQRYFGNA